jgi:hypothetical protein
VSTGKAKFAWIFLGLLLGLLLLWIDAGPTWDDTGMIAGVLVIASLMMGILARGLPLFVALAVGGPIAIVEPLVHANPDALFALLFAAIGAFGGCWVGKNWLFSQYESRAGGRIAGSPRSRKRWKP